MPFPDDIRPIWAAPRSAGVGLRIPERRADCTGVRPSWFPFQINVCDVDDPDPRDLTARERSANVPPPSPEGT